MQLMRAMRVLRVLREEEEVVVVEEELRILHARGAIPDDTCTHAHTQERCTRALSRLSATTPTCSRRWLPRTLDSAARATRRAAVMLT